MSPAKVIKMFDDCPTNNPSEERVLGYLKQYVGNMNYNDLRTFLRFATGSCVCTAGGLSVIFNTLSGFARRPTAVTCSCTLALPTTYLNYTDFAKEMDSIIKNEDYSLRLNAV